MKSWQGAMLTILVLVMGFTIGMMYERDTAKNILPSGTPTEWSGVSLEKLQKVKNLLDTHFVDSEKITTEKLEEWLIRGVLYSVEDPYTEYFNEKESEDFSKDMQGDFEGIGASLEKTKGKVMITEVMKGRPAAENGLLPGDIIVEVDGKSTDAETIYQTVDRIRGPKDTDVTLKIYRNGEMKDYVITRAKIHVESVTLNIKNNIAIIEVNQFGETLEKEFKQAFLEAKGKNPKGIIVDMRYNGGGYLDGAVALASYFLPAKTKVLGMKEKNQPEEEYFAKDQPEKDTSSKVVVLVNGGTASAAEIFSTALKEHKRATIVGEKTFGKGVVQQLFPLSIGSSEMVKITIAKWLTPHGIQVTHEAPLVPDIIVEWDRSEMTDEQKLQKYDPQLDKALSLFSL